MAERTETKGKDVMARGPLPLVERLQSQARKVLAAVQAQIRERESELESLREQAGRWLAAIDGQAPRRRGRPPGSGKSTRTAPAKSAPGRPPRRVAKAKRQSPPVDWEKVLQRLPSSFAMQDVAKATPMLKDHQQTRVIAVARWSRAGAIKKTAVGQYRKAGST